jgi:hypothetical protein
MALNSSGPISLGGATTGQSINIENGNSATAQVSLNDTAVRNLAGVASGAITMPTNFWGKSNIVNLSYTFSSNTANASLNVSTLSGYSAGKSNITITVNSGVYLYATSTGSYGLNLSGGTTGDTVTLVNNGYIMGCGGGGASGNDNTFSNVAGSNGGPALNLGFATTINNTNASAYIGGGGGGGGLGRVNAGDVSYSGGGAGGGGAGGGAGGVTWRTNGPVPSAAAGGSPGSSGANGSAHQGNLSKSGADYGWCTGGAGGRIFPGTGGSGPSGTGNFSYGNPVAGAGGGSGGSGSINAGNYNKGASSVQAGGGGSSNSGGGNGTINYSGFATNSGAGGGGGGWGASGGSGRRTESSSSQPGGVGGAGGKAVNLNGYTVTWVSGNTTRVYGTVS